MWAQLLNHQSRKTLKHINRAADTFFVPTCHMGGKLSVNAEHLHFLISGKQTVLSPSDLSGWTCLGSYKFLLQIKILSSFSERQSQGRRFFLTFKIDYLSIYFSFSRKTKPILVTPVPQYVHYESEATALPHT